MLEPTRVLEQHLYTMDNNLVLINNRLNSFVRRINFADKDYLKLTTRLQITCTTIPHMLYSGPLSNVYSNK